MSFAAWDQLRYHGSPGRRSFFEGWYFKFVPARGPGLSVIPGVSLSRKKKICFIQCVHGSTGRSFWAEWPLSEFEASRDPFSLRIGPNRFSLDGVDLDIDRPGFTLKGRVSFARPVLYPAKFFAPGVMGPYSFAPFMECYHAVVSLDHGLKGSLVLDGRKYGLDAGRGYIEKDWGTSFPRWWIWAQSNAFAGSPGTSFTLSVARVPWLGSAFTGFLCVLLHRGRIRTWASWTYARLLSLAGSGRSSRIVVSGPDSTVSISVRKKRSGLLKAPVFGAMDRSIHESLDAEIDLTVTGRDGKTVFGGTGGSAGFEMVGPIEEIPTVGISRGVPP